MDKTPQKVAKDTKRTARNDRGNYLNKSKEIILNEEKKPVKILTMQAMKLPMRPTAPSFIPPVLSQDLVILISMVLVPSLF